MLQDPFGDPFRPGTGSSLSEIFRRRGGGVRPRKPETAPEAAPQAEVEPESAPESSDEAPEESPGEKAVLRNPKWEIETVGFNEETDISVEVELPETHAHKTRVEFELFAETPDGPEAISKAEGTVEGGKAVARIPVHMPKFKDEFGNLLNKVKYFFTAKHSESDLLKAPDKTKDVEEMAVPLLESHVVPDIAFATGKSFPCKPESLKALSASLGEWKKKHKEGKLAVFGHADAVGEEAPNKGLSERRAMAVQAFLVKDAAAWETRYNEDKWGLASTQVLLRNLGHDPGASDGKDGPKTQAAVKAFQKQKGLGLSGQADVVTRKALYTAFMDACNTLKLAAKDFDAIDGKPHAGCSEFNRFEDTQGACAANRRVTVALLKATKNFPIQYPCKQGDIGPCKKQVARKGDRRTQGFGCLFYDKLIEEAAGQVSKPVKDGKAQFAPHAKHPFGYDAAQDMPSEDNNGKQSTVKGEPKLDYLSIKSGKAGLVELSYEGVTGAEIFFKFDKPDLAEIKVHDATSNPLIVEIAAKAEVKVTETKMKACFGSADGTVGAELGLVVLGALQYKATYMRIEDPGSAHTKLTTAMNIAKLESEINRLYRPGAATWKIEGEDTTTEIGYDVIKNGILDLEPGIDSEEWKKILAKCNLKKHTLVHVHDVRWSYFLTKDVKATDTVLHIKNYGGYLDFVGNNDYTIEDGAGNSAAIKVKSMDQAKLEITLEAAIGTVFKLTDKPALIWPLGGLGGNPTIISDVGSPESLIIYAAQELGHAQCGFDDIVERAAIMFGGSETGENLRYRPIEKFYHAGESESQWKIMKGR